MKEKTQFIPDYSNYHELSQDDQRMWRFTNLYKMTQDQIIDFYEACILPLESDEKLKQAIFEELRADMPKALLMREELQQELDDMKQRKLQFENAKKDAETDDVKSICYTDIMQEEEQQQMELNE
ncbi:hypothetical protein SS50377_26614 [Spironucleus salmonicida]|uniref:Uncharacterized protein n=1 Tax=Spironucleus salmonicida TaxID=348837 RepID=A0A9P8RWY0_9EUKA|nr:hypothetical protein SS50377_26614 [Spironucleus salmonicida]